MTMPTGHDFRDIINSMKNDFSPSLPGSPPKDRENSDFLPIAIPLPHF